MINRIIMPVISVPSSTEDANSTGFSDIVYTMWFSPAKDATVIWGLGPVFQLPTASGSEFGSGEFGIGPGKVFKLGGKLPTNINAHVYYNAVKPDGIGNWQTRFQITFMYPTKSMKAKLNAAGSS